MKDIVTRLNLPGRGFGPGENLIPPSLEAEGGDITVEQFRERFGERARFIEQLATVQDEAGISSIKKWLTAMNNFDRYAIAHLGEAGSDTLRPPQIPIMRSLHEFVESGSKRGHLALPTGYGKTVIFVEALEAMNLRTLVLVPRVKLVEQTEEKLEQFAPGLERGSFYGKKKEGGKQVTVSTYQSAIPRLESGEFDAGSYDFIILDEAHNALSAARIAALQRFRPDAIIIGVTATPVYSEIKQVGVMLPELIHHVTLHEAVMERSLVPLQTFCMRTSADLSRVKISNSTGDFNPSQLEGAVNTKVRNQAAVQLYRKTFMGRKAVAFCAGIAHAEAVSEEFTMAGIPAAYVHSQMSPGERKEAFKRFARREVLVLTGDKMFIEGFDDEEVSLAINLKPSLSLVDTEQRGGRVARLNPGDQYKFGTVVDFLDRGSVKPCILFADIMLGTVIPPDGSDIEEIKKRMQSEKESLANMEIEGLEIITEQSRIIELSADNQHQAPEGWLSFEEIAASTPQLDADVLRKQVLNGKILPNVKVIGRELHTGRFPSRTEKGRLSSFYSPGVIAELREFVSRLSRAAPADSVTVRSLEAKFTALSPSGLSKLPYRCFSGLTSKIIESAITYYRYNQPQEPQGTKARKMTPYWAETMREEGRLLQSRCVSAQLAQKIEQDLAPLIVSEKRPDGVYAKAELLNKYHILEGHFERIAREILSKNPDGNLIVEGLSANGWKAEEYYSEAFEKLLLEQIALVSIPEGWKSWDKIQRDLGCREAMRIWLVTQIIGELPEMEHNQKRYVDLGAGSYESLCASPLLQKEFEKRFTEMLKKPEEGWTNVDLLNSTVAGLARELIFSVIAGECKFFTRSNQDHPTMYLSPLGLELCRAHIKEHERPEGEGWKSFEEIREESQVLGKLPYIDADTILKEVLASLEGEGVVRADLEREFFTPINPVHNLGSLGMKKNYPPVVHERLDTIATRLCTQPDSDWLDAERLMANTGASEGLVRKVVLQIVGKNPTWILPAQLSSYRLPDLSERPAAIHFLNAQGKFVQMYSPAFQARVMEEIGRISADGMHEKSQESAMQQAGMSRAAEAPTKKEKVTPLMVVIEESEIPSGRKKILLRPGSAKNFPSLEGVPLEQIDEQDPHFALLSAQYSLQSGETFVRNIEHDPEIFEDSSGYYAIPKKWLMPRV